MRQRGVKNREQILKDCGAWLCEDPAAFRGRWGEAFAEPQKPLCVEIGSGKGQFLCGMAKLHPDVNFLAVEGGSNIYPRILQRAAEEGLENLRVIPRYAEDVRDWFAEGELGRVYLNFCDPWPKMRHAKRRLTHRERLAAYESCASPGAVLQLKTDNEALFAFSLEEIRSRGLLIRWVSRDLHHSPHAQQNVQTEYESKFASAGKPIFAVQAVLKREG